MEPLGIAVSPHEENIPIPGVCVSLSLHVSLQFPPQSCGELCMVYILLNMDKIKLNETG